MRLKSFTTVAIRLMGLMSIFYGVLMTIFLLVTFFMFSGGAYTSGLGSVFLMQFLLPALLVVAGLILIAISTSLGESLSRGLEDGPHS
ncbi:MAG TPA: hypothetical protein VJT09_03885 [Pyrinomonadaceae bacterium]|nr:hypothetical protein [Pyrinomonadaceae bacterium]